MPRFRSVPSAVHDSPEWVRSSALARMVHRCMRPSAGVLSLTTVSQGEPLWVQFQRKAAETNSYFSPEECQVIVRDALASGLWEDHGGALVIPAFPASFEAQREALRLGARGGLPASERMRQMRERQRDERLSSPPPGPSVEPSNEGVGQDRGTAPVTAPVTDSEPVTEAPSLTPPGPPKGGRGEGVGPRGAVAPTRGVVEIGQRSPEELKALGADAVGELAVRILGRAAEVFAPEASPLERRALGAVILALGYPELELRAVALHWAREPAKARALYAFDQAVRSGGRITVGLLVGKPDRNGVHGGKGLRRAREVAVPWAEQKSLFEKYRGPVSATAKSSASSEGSLSASG